MNDPATASPAPRDRSSQVRRAFALLEAVVAEGRSLSLVEIAARLDVPKATVHRIAGRLEQDGYLLREPDGKHYVVGPRLTSLAVGTLSSSVGRAPRHAILEALAAETGETCNLGMVEGNAVVYLDRVESRWPLRLHFEIGSRLPLHCVAMGKLFLSRMPRRARERLYAAAPLRRFTEHTITDPAALEAELARIRDNGIAINNQEYMVGLVGIAVAVPRPERAGKPAADARPDGAAPTYAALAVHAPLPRMTTEDARRHLPALRRAAERMGQLLYAPAEAGPS